jgi:hypothetical protein
LFDAEKKDVDARDERGHDDKIDSDGAVDRLRRRQSAALTRLASPDQPFAACSRARRAS